MSKINLQKSNQKTEVSFNMRGIDTYGIFTLHKNGTGSSTEIKWQLPNVYTGLRQSQGPGQLFPIVPVTVPFPCSVNKPLASPVNVSLTPINRDVL